MIHFVVLVSISYTFKKLWELWNIRVGILFSLLVQLVLIFVAPLRKSSRSNVVIFLIWIAYMMADNTAILVIGLISNSFRNRSACPELIKPPQSSDLLAFWAPFLLLHLGGPDTITAFSLEDNQLYMRHFVILCFQVGAVFYIFFQSLPNHTLLVPTILVFVAGTIKYVERTAALYFASLDKYRDSLLKPPDPGPNYAKIMEEYASNKSTGIPTKISSPPAPDEKAKDSERQRGVHGVELKPFEVMHEAYSYFKKFRGLVVDLIFSLREGDESSGFFKRIEPPDALNIIEAELNFMYASFYTKVEIVHSIPGYFCRFISSGLLMATLAIFFFHTKKDVFHGVDIKITYALLLCGIFLDAIAFLMLVFSDRTVAAINDPEKTYCKRIVDVFNWFHAFRKLRWINCKCDIVKHKVLATPFLFRRWSESIASHSLICYCLKSGLSTIHEFPANFWKIMFEKNPSYNEVESKVPRRSYCLLRINYMSTINTSNICFRKIIKPIKELVDEMRYVSSEPLTQDLWKFIMEQLKNKSERALTRGEGVLSQDSPLRKYVDKVQYDESLLLWHIATDLCFYTENVDVWEENYRLIMEARTSYQTEVKLAPIREARDKLSQQQISKILSDYMLYLLVYQPNMMSSVAGIGKMRYRDTCAEAEIFFLKLYQRSSQIQRRLSIEVIDEKTACEEILSVNTDVEPVEIKGERSKSVLFNASMLAKELKRMDSKDRWEILSKMWVELLSYAACHCKASTHAERLSKGGEFISFVWLLLAHFGLGEQFQIGGHGKGKLIVGK